MSAHAVRWRCRPPLVADSRLAQGRSSLRRRASLSRWVALLLGVVVVTGLPSSWQAAAAQPAPVRRHLEPQSFDPIHPRGPYLGQKPPGLVPKVFAPGFISTTAEEYHICFSPDGNEIYFSRYTAADDSNTLWVTRQADGMWTSPVRAEFTGPYFNIEAFITRDNRSMYFVSQRGTSNIGIWTMTRTVSGWSAPVKLGQPLSAAIKMGPSLSENGNLYFTEVSNNSGRFFLAQNQDGRFATPVPLSPTVNAYTLMGHAFVAPDESWLVFDAEADMPQSDGGVLFVTFKGQGGDWLTPIRLNLANKGSNEYCPTISPDGKYLFFARHNGTHDDIWWVDSRAVFDLRPEAGGDPGPSVRGER
jgi:Tol biopolymer transport system component